MFGSELKALSKFPSIDLNISRRSSYYYSMLGYIPAPYSIYENTFKILPSEVISFDRESIKRNIYYKITSGLDSWGTNIEKFNFSSTFNPLYYYFRIIPDTNSMNSQEFKAYYEQHSEKVEKFIKSHVTEDDIKLYTENDESMSALPKNHKWNEFVEDIVKISSINLNL